jgi:hypothetical protein
MDLRVERATHVVGVMGRWVFSSSIGELCVWRLDRITAQNIPYAAILLPPALPGRHLAKKKGLADEANPFFLLAPWDGLEPPT